MQRQQQQQQLEGWARTALCTLRCRLPTASRHSQQWSGSPKICITPAAAYDFLSGVCIP